MYLFDFDGTLVDSNFVWADIDRDFLARRGLAPTAEYTDFVAHSIFPAAARFTREYYQLPDSPEEIMAEWMSMARRAYGATIPLKPGAREYLLRCRDEGAELTLFTSSQPELCRLCLNRHGLTALFRHVVFAQELGVEKRDPRCFPLLGEHLGTPLSRCILFDDSPAACRSAMAAGLTVVGVRDGFFLPEEDQVRAASHRYITGFDQLLAEPFPPPVPGRTADW